MPGVTILGQMLKEYRKMASNKNSDLDVSFVSSDLFLYRKKL